MHNAMRVAGIVLALVIVLLLILLATRVGGIAIRSGGSRRATPALTVSNPALRGVPTVPHWDELDQSLGTVQLVWKDSSGELVVGEADVIAQQAVITLPCGGDATGTLVLLQKTTQKILATVALTLLPPSAECALQ